MFTGLVEKTGIVLACDSRQIGRRLSIQAAFVGLEAGESIAVQGVCLTLLPHSTAEILYFDLSPETLQLTTLGQLCVDEPVNLERALLASSRLGGHYVSGHVDTTATLHKVQIQGDYVQLTLTGFSKQHSLYLLPKGSITVDGVSLTINQVYANNIELMLVPHTLAHTTLGSLKAGQTVNIEFDYFTRIIAQQVRMMRELNFEDDLCSTHLHP